LFAREVRTMSRDRCAYCGAEINEASVEFRGLFFCSDECCEDYEDNLTINGEPNPEELAANELEEVDLEEVDFEEDEVSEDFDDDFDDDFKDEF
jgi:hypothetical protein